MRRETTFLRAVVIAIGLAVLALIAYPLPYIAVKASEHFPAYMLYPVLACIYASAIPFFIALFQALKLLGLIDADNAFSESSVGALGKIKWCAAAVSAIYAICSPFLYLVAEMDDAPGFVAGGLILAAAAFVIAVFAAILEKLLRRAIDIKAENDLTV